MAKVFDTPTYTNQTAFKALSTLYASEDAEPGLCSDSIGRFEGIARVGVDDYISAMIPNYIGQCANYWAEMMDVDSATLEDTFLKYVASQPVNKRSTWAVLERQGSLLNEVLRQSTGKRILCDENARFAIVAGYYSGRYCSNTADNGKLFSRRALTHKIAIDFAVYSAVASKHGTAVIDKIRSIRNVWNTRPGARALSTAEAFEKLLITSPSRKMRETHDEALNDYTDVRECAKGFKVVGRYWSYKLGCLNAWMFFGLTIIEYEDCVYIVDRATVEQLRECTACWAGAIWNSGNYRTAGCDDRERRDMDIAVQQSILWIGHSLYALPLEGRRKLAKRMKTDLARMQNNYLNSIEPLNLHSNEREAALKADADSYAPCDWYAHCTSLNIPDRWKFDVAYLFHLLPCPDGDPHGAFKKCMAKLRNSNTVNWVEWERYMRYTKSLDLVSVIARCHSADSVSVRFEGDAAYDWKEENWAKNSAKGNPDLPPEDQWGKVFLWEHFPVPRSLETWYHDVADVTHVMPDFEMYSDHVKHQEMDQSLHNELLYAWKYAPLLGCANMPADVWNRAAAGDPLGDRVCLMALKAENTKFGDTARETLSADDHLRELVTEWDRMAVQLNAMYRSVTLRKPADTMSTSMHSMALATDNLYALVALFLSLDIAGWSPCACREAMMSHHMYIQGTNKRRPMVDFMAVWSRIRVIMDKRGARSFAECGTGMFQGFTGTLDTHLHYTMASYVIRTAKDRGILGPKVKAQVLVLIDDGVLSFRLDGDEQHKQEICDRFLGHARGVYASLGFVIEASKTIYSTRKFIYLNRYFACVSEVLTPMKTTMRINREFGKKFSSTPDQFGPLMTSAQSAVNKGACPLATYVYAIERCLDLAFQSCPNLAMYRSEKFFIVGLAPRSIGGWGLPVLSSFLTKETPDQLTAWLSGISIAMKAFADVNMKNSVSSCMNALLRADFIEGSAASFMETPRSVRLKIPKDPQSVVSFELRKKMKEVIRSVEFLEALMLVDDEKSDIAMWEFIRSGSWDADLLSGISECTPDHVVASMVDKAERNELLLVLLPFKQRSLLARKVYKAGKAVLMYGFEIVQPPVEWRHISATTEATAIREAYYEFLGVDIVNHTITHPLDFLSTTRPAVAHRSTINVRHVPGQSPPGDRRNDWGGSGLYNNIYDSNTGVTKYHAMRTRGVVDSSSVILRTSTPAQRAIRKGAMLCAYVNAKGGDGNAIWNFIKWRWGNEDYNMIPQLDSQYGALISTKRMGSGTRTHPILCFSNAQRRAEVECAGLDRWLDRVHVHIDRQSQVAAVRCLGLIEIACGLPVGGVIGFNLRPYSFDPSALVTFNTVFPWTAPPIIGRERLGLTFRELNENFEIDDQGADQLPDGEVMDERRALCGVFIGLTYVDIQKGVIVPGTLNLPPKIPYIARRRVGRSNIDVGCGTGGISDVQHVSRMRSKVGGTLALVAMLIKAALNLTPRILPDNFFLCSFTYRSLLPLYNELFMIREDKQRVAGTFFNIRKLFVDAELDPSMMNMYFPPEDFRDIPADAVVSSKWVHPISDRDRVATMLIFLMSAGRMATRESYASNAFGGTALLRKAMNYSERRQHLIMKQYHDGQRVYRLARDKAHFYRAAKRSILMGLNIRELVESLSATWANIRDPSQEEDEEREGISTSFGDIDIACEQVIRFMEVCSGKFENPDAMQEILKYFVLDYSVSNMDRSGMPIGGGRRPALVFEDEPQFAIPVQASFVFGHVSARGSIRTYEEFRNEVHDVPFDQYIRFMADEYTLPENEVNPTPFDISIDELIARYHEWNENTGDTNANIDVV